MLKPLKIKRYIKTLSKKKVVGIIITTVHKGFNREIFGKNHLNLLPFSSFSLFLLENFSFKCHQRNLTNYFFQNCSTNKMNMIFETFAKKITEATSNTEVLELWSDFGNANSTEEIVELYKKVAEKIFNAVKEVVE